MSEYSSISPRLQKAGIVIGGRSFEEWTDYNVTSNIFSATDSFSMRCGPVDTKLREFMLPGQRIDIYFTDGEEHVQVLTGWTESYTDTVSTGSEMTEIGGRDLASDLVENSVPEDLEVKNRALYDIAEELCDLFTIPVLCTNEANRIAVADKKKYKKLMKAYNASQLPYNSNVVAFQKLLADTFEVTDAKDKQFKSILAANGIVPGLRPPFVPGIFQTLDEAEPRDGQSIWEFLVEYAKRLEVHMWFTSSGMLVMQRPRYDQDPMYLFINRAGSPENNNVISRSFNINIAGMPTVQKRTGKRVKIGEKKERLQSVQTSSRLIPSSETSTMPTGILRVASSFERVKWRRDMESDNLDELDRKNYYDLLAKETGFIGIDITVRGHDQGGKLYTPDTVARFVDDRLGIDDLFYVSSCEYTQDPKREDMEGQVTRIRMTPLDSWSPES
jgi:prophage tail gpP-like protein